MVSGKIPGVGNKKQKRKINAKTRKISPGMDGANKNYQKFRGRKKGSVRMKKITIEIPELIYDEMVDVVNRPENKKFKITYGDWICHFITGYRELELMVKQRDKIIEELRKNQIN